MAKKQYLSGAEAQQTMLRGIQKLDDAVGSTLGPLGKYVLIDRGLGWPTATKDGVTVAREVLLDGFEGTGARFVQEAASKTADTAGDGTTTSTVLAAEVYRLGLDAISTYSVVALKNEMDRVVADVEEDIRRNYSRRVTGEMVAQIGTIAANNDRELGLLIAKAMKEAGPNGVVAVEESKSYETSITKIDGMEFNEGYISPWFVTDQEKQICVLENPLILLIDRPLVSLQGMHQMLESIAKTSRPLLVIADDVTGEALATLCINKQRGGLLCCAVKCPATLGHKKEMLKDIAAVTSGTAVLQETGMSIENITPAHLGQAERVIIRKNTTTIINGHGNTRLREQEIKGLLSQSTGEIEKEKLQERLAKLSGGVTLLQIGAITEAEMREKKARVEDAMFATRCAVREGVVPGGGFTLARCAANISGDTIGGTLLSRALKAPALRILKNAGYEESVLDVVLKEDDHSYGFDSLNGDYVDLVSCGIIDPTQVVISALKNAVSVASVLLTTNTLILDVQDEMKGSGF